MDAYGEPEQVTTFYTMMENDLRLTFETKILGMAVIVEKQRISFSELPLPSPFPKRAEWIVAYRYWRTGKIR